MRKFIHYLLIPICIVFTPFFWIGANMGGMRISLREFYKDLFDHIKSKKSFGIFD